MSKTELALTTVNCSWRDCVSRETFLRIIRKEKPPGEWSGHIVVLLNEVHPLVLRAMAAENNFDVSLLAELFETLPPVFQSEHSKSFFRDGVIMDGKYC